MELPSLCRSPGWEAHCNANIGSYYCNYKGTFSIVLLAVVDTEYKSIYVNVGCNGRVSDGGVSNSCSLYQALETGIFMLPPTIPLLCRTQPFPNFFVANNAFAMRQYIMKPCPFKGQPAPNCIFNYQLCRARRTVENVFGITVNRFCVLRKPLIQKPPSTVNIVLAVCVLHNFLMSTHRSWSSYLQPRLLDTESTDTHEVQWYMARRRDAIKKRIAVTKTTSLQLTKQYLE